MITLFQALYSPRLGGRPAFGERARYRPRPHDLCEFVWKDQAAQARDGSVLMVRLSAAITTTRVMLEQLYFERRLF